jgi:hypothetical protein
MNFSHKIKETSLAVLPIAALVIALSLTIAPLSRETFFAFVPGTAMIILGLSFFLAGTDLGILPAGSFIGSAITRSRKLTLILGTGLIVGFIITIAEPDLAVLGSQVEDATGYIRSLPLILSIAAGVGIFVSLALARAVFQIPFRAVVIAGYALVFALGSRISPTLAAIAFDSGGATTGPMTVPFIIALGIGVASVRIDKASGEDNFGFTGIASIGPIAAVAILALIISGGETAGAVEPATAISIAQSTSEATQEIPNEPVAFADAENPLPGEIAPPIASLFGRYAHETPIVAKGVLLALAPVALLLSLFQLFLLKLPPRQITRIAFGFIYAFIGLVLFFLGTDTAFLPAGRELGFALARIGNGWPLIPIALALGATIVCAEPAIWILTEQVEEVSGGNVRRTALLVALACGVAVAVALSMWRILSGFSVWLLLIPSYAAAIALTFVSPRLFTAIAFDSGGVASGPMASTFVLAMALGAASAQGTSNAENAFGLIAMIAVTPLISIQVLGWAFSVKERTASENRSRANERNARIGGTT